MTIFANRSFRDHEQVLFCNDSATGLKAIIAIHDSTLGPALGGCRVWNYSSEEEALEDVLRLSRGMTYKAAISGLNLGGGKAVIIGDAKQIKSEALFRAFGRFVNSLSGRYISAEDVNMTVKDCEYIRAETPYVTGVSDGSGDPSPVTALGVFHGIRASAKHKLKKDKLAGLKVAVQGVGHVGTYLSEYLHAEGVQLFVNDINQQNLDNVCKKYGATAVSETEIHALDVDVYAPCALGGILHDETIPQIKAPIVAGAANNQLLDEEKHGQMLRERNILYAPDYVINAGGLINVYQELKGYNEQIAHNKAADIYDTLLSIYAEAEREAIPTHVASNRIAEKRIMSMRGVRDLRNTLDNQIWSTI